MPELVREMVGGERRSRLEQQESQLRALPWASKRQRLPFVYGLDGPEQPELDALAFRSVHPAIDAPVPRGRQQPAAPATPARAAQHSRHRLDRFEIA